MSDQIVPGPCCPEIGCPPPSSIDCIQVNKLYDFCFQTITRDNICFDLPASCGEVPPGSTAVGTVTSVTCTTSSIVPILNSSGQPTGFANVTLLVTVTESITVTGPDGTTLCTFSGQFSFFTSITICAPHGVSINCQAPATAVGPCVILNEDVCCNVSVCLLIESVALVNLLVPNYGFCVPAPCVVAPAAPFTCPPVPLYPPQCVTPPPTTTPTPPPMESPINGPLGGSAG